VQAPWTAPTRRYEEPERPGSENRMPVTSNVLVQDPVGAYELSAAAAGAAGLPPPLTAGTSTTSAPSTLSRLTRSRLPQSW